MKISEVQVRQIIKEELHNVLNENDNQLDPGRPFSAKEIAGVAVGGLTLERLLYLLQNTMHEHPEWKEPIESFLMKGHEAVHGVGNAVSSMFENKKRK
jgi:hypothetical protein